MSTILDTDLFLTQRGTALHHVAAVDLKTEVPWTPADMTTLLWLDASDASSVIIGTGTSIIQWSDKSGNDYDAFQGFASRQPELLGSEVDFTNVNWVLPLPNMPLVNGKTDFAIFFCARKPFPDASSRSVFRLIQTATTQEVLVDVQENTGTSASACQLIVSNSSTASSSRTTWPRVMTQPFLVGLEWDQTRSPDLGYAYHRFNGSVATSMTTTGTRAVSVPPAPTTQEVSASNAAVALSGFLSTMVIMRAADYNANIEKLEGWAAHNWGLTSALPPAHPYKDAPPTV